VKLPLWIAEYICLREVLFCNLSFSLTFCFQVAATLMCLSLLCLTRIAARVAYLKKHMVLQLSMCLGWAIKTFCMGHLFEA